MIGPGSTKPEAVRSVSPASWGETPREGAEQRAEQVLAGCSVRPRWLFVVGVPRFRFGNLEAFAGLALGCLHRPQAATVLEAPRHNGLLVEFI